LLSLEIDRLGLFSYLPGISLELPQRRFHCDNISATNIAVNSIGEILWGKVDVATNLVLSLPPDSEFDRWFVRILNFDCLPCEMPISRRVRAPS
jgi:hypothetical protein